MSTENKRKRRDQNQKNQENEDLTKQDLVDLIKYHKDRLTKAKAAALYQERYGKNPLEELIQNEEA